jgi:hypothetical protein
LLAEAANAAIPAIQNTHRYVRYGFMRRSQETATAAAIIGSLPPKARSCLCRLVADALRRRTRSHIDIADHMQMVVIEVDNFAAIFVLGRIGNRPTDADRF